MSQALMQQFIKHLPPTRKGIQVLDFGSGYSYWAVSLAGLGYSVTAVDQRPQSVFHFNMNYVQADMLEWLRGLGPDVMFDGIFIRYVIHFFSKDVVANEIMPLLRQHLAPGGVIAIETLYMPPLPPLDEDHRPASYWTVDELWELVNDMKICEEEEMASSRLDMDGNERLFYSSLIVAKDIQAKV